MNTWPPQSARPDSQNHVALGVLIALAVVGAALALLTALDRRDTRDESTLTAAATELHDARIELQASVSELRSATATLQEAARTLERRATTVNILDVMPPAPPAPPLAVVSPEVDCTEAGRCTISRGELERLLGDPAQLLRQVRVMPAVRDGRTLGVKLYGIRPNSLPKALGFQNGDLVTAINGQAIHGVDMALSIYTSLRPVKVLEFAIERKGAPLSLTLTIE